MQRLDPSANDAKTDALLRQLNNDQLLTLLDLFASYGWDGAIIGLEVHRCGGFQRFLHIYASTDPLSPAGEEAMRRIEQIEPNIDQRYRLPLAMILHATGQTLERVQARMRELGLYQWIHDDAAQIATVKELVGHDAFVRASLWVLEQFATAGRA